MKSPNRWWIVFIAGACANCAQHAPAHAQTVESAPVRVAAQPMPQTFVESVAELDKVGDYAAIVAAAGEWQKLYPTDAQGPFYEARARYYNGDFAGAIAAWERSKKVNPDFGANADSWLVLARKFQEKWGQQAPLTLVDGDLKIAGARERARAQSLLAAGNYDEIERVAAQLAQSKAMTADGDWLLIPFFRGLSDATEGATEADWEKQRALIEAWQTARPQSALARAALAQSWLSGAWLARGSDYANKVPPEAWEKVESRIARMGEVLDKGGDIAEQIRTSPLFFSLLQSWALLSGLPSEQYDALFEIASQSYPEATMFWTDAVYRLLPRWYGEPGEWEAFAQAQADQIGQTQGKVAGDALYARMVWQVMLSSYKYDNIWEKTTADWLRAGRGMKAILAQNPDSLSAQTVYFEMAFRAEDWEAAREMLQQIAGKVNAQYYSNSREAFAKRRVYVLNKE